MMSRTSGGNSNRWSFEWIGSFRDDLRWYIGSCLVGWLYLGLVFGFGRSMQDPLRDPLLTLSWGSLELPLSLGVLVFGSWALGIDAPHVWATLARTFLDPDEWRARRRVLVTSLLLFLLGPAAIVGPYLIGVVIPLDASTMMLGAHVFLVFFRLWAYYHVVRQHWGFLALYKRKNHDTEDATENRVDYWFFNLSMYMPLILFVSSPWYAKTGMPSLGLEFQFGSGYSIAELVHPVASLAYPILIACYVGFNYRRYRQGVRRNGAKFLFLLSVVPLHLVVFSHPVLALFLIPIVTVGHNLQYHRIVWTYGRKKYCAAPGADVEEYRAARFAFSSVPVYFGIGLLFTFALYQGPWVEAVKQGLSLIVDDYFLDGLLILAGVVEPSRSSLGAQVVSSLFLGWAMQHYYLDSKIWRVGRDRKLANHLGL